MPLKEQLLKRLRKTAGRGMRGWPAATIAFYGPDLSRASKAAVGIVPSQHAEAGEMRSWNVESGDVCYVERGRRFRIISARRATKREQDEYNIANA